MWGPEAMKGGREARLTDWGDWGIWTFGDCQLRMVGPRGRRQGGEGGLLV